MSSPHVANNSALTLEEVYASKHAWLLRWALYFSRNDLPNAEDLVQDAFMRLLLSWESVGDRKNVEPLLYTYLKYAHLNERRREHACSFQSLSSIDYNAPFIHLRTSHDAAQLDLQNELRRVAGYLLWRKRSAKFASIFLLRFLHGYFPEEIMRICLISRHAVDLNVRYARKEVRAFLESKLPLRLSRRSPVKLLELPSRHIPIPAHAFTEELREATMSANNHPCERLGQLQTRYQALPALPIDCELLSHLVSCESCLGYAARAGGVSRMAHRTPDSVRGYASYSRFFAEICGPATDQAAAPETAIELASLHGYVSLSCPAFQTKPLSAQSSQAQHP
jgi:DNA-directed RNA polymerase specialized sigma24 family protein